MTKTSKFRPYLAAAIVNLPVLSLGLSVGWMSVATPILQSVKPTFGTDEPLSDDIITWLGSLQFLGGIIGVYFVGQIAERFGRKITGYLLSIPLITGWTAVLIAKNHIWLMVGRFIMGLSGTGSLLLAPLYVSEMSEDSYRGELGSFLMLFFNLGVVLAYLVGALVEIEYLTLFCDCIPIFFLFCFHFLPESPVYLWTKGRKDDARLSLLWFRSDNHVQVERELIVLDSVIDTSNKNEKSIPLSRLYDSKGTIKGMIIGFALYAFQQFCGVLVLLTYTSDILLKSKLEFPSHIAMVIIGTIQLIATYLNSLIVDRIDRKVLTVISNMGMGISLFIIGAFFYLQKHSETYYLPNYTPFLFICIHVVCYVLSASMPYIITSEVLTPEIKPLALSITSFFGTSMAFVSCKIYSFLISIADMYGNFWFYTLWCFIAVIFTVFFIPETRGKNLVDILKELNGMKIIKKDNKTDYDLSNKADIPLKEQC